MRKTILLLAFIVAALFLNGCASIFSGTRQTVRIETYPPGADIEIDGLTQGTTPATIQMRKNLNSKTITLTKEGYQTKVFTPTNSFDMLGLLNLFFWPGFIIDAVNGAMMKYDQSSFQIKLEPAAEASSK
jgi:uncharacterized protein YceK